MEGVYPTAVDRDIEFDIPYLQLPSVEDALFRSTGLDPRILRKREYYCGQAVPLTFSNTCYREGGSI